MPVQIPEDFSQVTFRQAERLIQTNEPENYTVAKDFFEGDHWQGGEGWPQAIDKTADGATFMKRLIESMFESKNVVKEVTERFLDGILDVQPDIRYVPDEGEEGEDVPDEVEDRAEERTAMLQRWIEQKSLLKDAREAVKWATFGGRGYVRPFIPPGRRDEQGRLSGEFTEVMGDIFTLDVEPSNAVIFTHPDTQRELSVFHYVPADLEDVHDPNRDDDLERVELSWIDPETGETVLRILQEGEKPSELRKDDDVELSDRELRVDLNGRLMLQEIEIDRLITEQVISSQKSLNLTKTMMTHNEVSAGFSERMFLNAQPPGNFEQQEDGSREFVPNELKRGPMRDQFIVGIETTDEMGQRQYETPSVVMDEADDPEVYLKGKESKRKDILDEVSQTHVLMNEGTQQSGRSRLIARHEFTKTLEKAVPDVTDLLRDVTQNVVDLARILSGSGGTEEDGIRLNVEVYRDSGPLTPEEMSALSTMTETGLMSLRTALSRAGIHDIEGEIQRIEEEGGDRVQRLIERANLIKTLVAAGGSIEGAARIAGFDEEEAQRLATGADGSVAQAVSQQAGDGAPR